MGIFFDAPTDQPRRAIAIDALRPYIEESLQAAPPQAGQLDVTADATLRQVRSAATSVVGGTEKEFQTGRFVGAVIILAILIGLGIWSEAQGWKDSSKAVWGLAATAFGIIVGILGGESKKT